MNFGEICMKKSHLLLGIIVLLVSASLAFGTLITTVSADSGSDGSTASPTVTDIVINPVITTDSDTDDTTTQTSDTPPISIDTQSDISTPTPTITLEGTNVVCDTDAALPHWGNGASIIASTATDYVTQSNGHCQLASGWNFQWSDQSTDPHNTPGDTVGEAAGFTTFGPTDTTGSTSTTIPFPDTITQFHVREVLQQGYIPFTFDETIRDNSNSDSGEFYCETDGLNYDNFEYIRNPQAGSTYHCVAFNVPVTPPATQTPNTPPIVIPPVDTSGGSTQTPSTNNGTLSGGGFSGGGGGGSTAPVGQVLGASTSCGEYITSYVALGGKNDPANVTNLQAFLNSFLHTSISIDGVYGPQTFAAVKQFQTQESDQVLLPWKNFGNPNLVPTGYVYKTTKREINNIVCPALNLPLPLLP